MRVLNAKFELFGAAHVLTTAGNRERRQFELRGTHRIVRKYKNSGNEAKKSLKTKDGTFFNAVNCARFARKSAPI